MDTHTHTLTFEWISFTTRTPLSQSQSWIYRNNVHAGHYLREGRGLAELEGHRVPDCFSFTKWPCYFCVQEMRSHRCGGVMDLLYQGLPLTLPVQPYTPSTTSPSPPPHPTKPPRWAPWRKKIAAVSQDQLVTSREKKDVQWWRWADDVSQSSLSPSFISSLHTSPLPSRLLTRHSALSWWWWQGEFWHQQQPCGHFLFYSWFHLTIFYIYKGTSPSCFHSGKGTDQTKLQFGRLFFFFF